MPVIHYNFGGAGNVTYAVPPGEIYEVRYSTFAADEFNLEARLRIDSVWRMN